MSDSDDIITVSLKCRGDDPSRWMGAEKSASLVAEPDLNPLMLKL